MNDIQVVKVGGAQGNDLNAVAQDAARLWKAGQRIVLVHGGSAEATALGESLGRPPRFAQSPGGHTSRLTDGETLEVFLMATALVNRRLVAALRAEGVSAVGLSGLDGGCLTAERKGAFRVIENGRVRVVRDDLSGKPVGADSGFLRLLLDGGHLPVLAPVGSTVDGQALNVDGDRAAACVAGALGAQTLALLTAVPGLMRDVNDPCSLVQEISADEMDQAMSWAQGRMKKKVMGAAEALGHGVRRVVIAGSAGARPIEDALAGRGTCLVPAAVTA